jgi:hypothetical protein
MVHHKNWPLGTLLLRNLHEARQMSQKCEKVCKDIEMQTDKGTVAEWCGAKSSWERDTSKPDPFKLAEKRRSNQLMFVRPHKLKPYPLPIGASLDAVKKRLADAEALEATTGASLPHTLHPSSFVRMGLEIEDQQYVLHYNL